MLQGVTLPLRDMPLRLPNNQAIDSPAFAVPGSQFSDGFSALSMVSTSTGPLVDSSFRPNSS